MRRDGQLLQHRQSTQGLPPTTRAASDPKKQPQASRERGEPESIRMRLRVKKAEKRRRASGTARGPLQHWHRQRAYKQCRRPKVARLRRRRSLDPTTGPREEERDEGDRERRAEQSSAGPLQHAQRSPEHSDAETAIAIEIAAGIDAGRPTTAAGGTCGAGTATCLTRSDQVLRDCAGDAFYRRIDGGEMELREERARSRLRSDTSEK